QRPADQDGSGRGRLHGGDCARYERQPERRQRPEPVHHPRRRHLYASDRQFGPVRHHPRLRHHHRPRPRLRGAGADAAARDAVHRRRGVLRRHGCRSHPHPVGGPHQGGPGAARAGHGGDPAAVLPDRARRGAGCARLAPVRTDAGGHCIGSRERPINKPDMATLHVNDLLKIAVERGASDLHLKVGSYPMLRLRGGLTPASEDHRLDHEEMMAFAAAVLPTGMREKFKDNHEVDLAYSVAGLGRFRCNTFQQRGTIGMIFRVIPMRVQTIDQLLLPEVLKKVSAEERGLVLVTGTTGSGKSTTLAAMLDEINATRTTHIMTVEDPIEYLHRDKMSIISQREIGVDTTSFSQALRSALRQDPDVILVGEMRDFETIETALLAAETGHLVFSTLHTVDATETINRIVAVFPPHQQQQIRIQLSGVLKA